MRTWCWLSKLAPIAKLFAVLLHAAGLNHCYVAPVDYTEIEAALSAALEQRRHDIEQKNVRREALTGYSLFFLTSSVAANRCTWSTIPSRG
jgi:hypothetical protein